MVTRQAHGGLAVAQISAPPIFLKTTRVIFTLLLKLPATVMTALSIHASRPGVTSTFTLHTAESVVASEVFFSTIWAIAQLPNYLILPELVQRRWYPATYRWWSGEKICRTRLRTNDGNKCAAVAML